MPALLTALLPLATQYGLPLILRLVALAHKPDATAEDYLKLAADAETGEQILATAREKTAQSAP